MEKVPVPSPTVCAVSPVSANWRTWVLRQAWSLSLYCTVLYCTVLCCTVLYLGGGVAGTQPEHEGAQVVGGEVHRHPDLTDVT